VSDIEFQEFDALKRLDDAALNTIVTEGVNLHIHTSKASAAKRILEKRLREEQFKLIASTKAINENIVRSNGELRRISNELNYVVVILNFFRRHWFPTKSKSFRVLAFIFGTVVLGIVLNIVSDAIVTFVFFW
jgi:hypothetical protein